MKAAIIEAAGTAPVYGEFSAPIADGEQVCIDVIAASLSHITRSRAAGTHYSATAQDRFVAGIDGVGRREDGERVYFFLPEAPFGAMAERSLADKRRCIVLPPELDSVTAAAIAIPGMSSWAALVERARLIPGETVIVNGATGASGRLAVQIAKQLGAGKVVATGRNKAALAALLTLGADVVIDLSQAPSLLEQAFAKVFQDGVGVVLDYLWGTSAECLLTTGASVAPRGPAIRFIQIGSVSAPTITLPSAALRSSSIQMMGSGLNSVPMPRLFSAIEHVFHSAVARGGYDLTSRAIPLEHVAQHWDEHDSQCRTVFTTGLE